MNGQVDIFTQIMLGSLGLGASSLVHIAVLLGGIMILRRINDRIGDKQLLRPILLTATALAAVVVAHTIPVWLWAAAILAIGALPTLDDAIYFSLVTYTTVGYGDVTLRPDARLFGAMAAVAGVLNFGLSTAFLVRFIDRMWPEHTGADN